MTDRITDRDIANEVSNLTVLMRETGIIKPDSGITLHQGSDGVAKYNNYLLVGKTNVWPNGEGGRTKRDAYRALRHMIAALSLAIEAKQDGKPIA